MLRSRCKTRQQRPLGASNLQMGVESMYRFCIVVIIAFILSACQSGVEVPIQGYNVYAVGAEDFNGDGVPDLYTTNHNASSSILLGAKVPWVTLPHDPRFPALSDLWKEPERPQNGALLYWHRRKFKIASGSLKEPLRGSVIFLAKPVIEDSIERFDIERLDETHWQVHFTLASGQKLVIRHEPRYITGLPIKLHIDGDPSMLSIGKIGDHPDVDTEIRLYDYHALLAKDIDRDGDIDIIALGGGMRGRAKEIVPDAMEHTFINEGSEFLVTPGPPKLGCATRSAVWEGDTMRVSCDRGQPDNVWRWIEGEWVGAPDDKSTYNRFNQKFKRIFSCSIYPWLRHMVPLWSYRIGKGKQWCVEADFDDDGKNELVVVTRRAGSRITTVRLK